MSLLPLPSHRSWALAIATLTLLCACAPAATRTVPASRVEVTWTDPAAFAEVRDNPGIRQIRPEEWLRELARHLQIGADRILAPGQHLKVTFTDIKRAGTFEPWRGPKWNDVRVIKEIYPPSIDLRFTLTGADGTVLREGERKLRDPGFLSRAVAGRSDDPLRYEKRLLDDWLRNEFAAPRPG